MSPRLDTPLSYTGGIHSSYQGYYPHLFTPHRMDTQLSTLPAVNSTSGWSRLCWQGAGNVDVNAAGTKVGAGRGAHREGMVSETLTWFKT